MCVSGGMHNFHMFASLIDISTQISRLSNLGSVRRHGHRILKEKFFSIIFEFPIVFVCKTVSTLGQEVWDLQFLIVGRCFPPN